MRHNRHKLGYAGAERAERFLLAGDKTAAIGVAYSQLSKRVSYETISQNSPAPAGCAVERHQ
jgi:hypothetical protein